jgi:hypothetical protein
MTTVTTKLLLEYADIFTALVCTGVLVAMWWRRALRSFAVLAVFLMTEIVSQSIQVPLMFFRKAIGISVGAAYSILFYSHVAIFCVQSLLLIAVIYGVFRLAMRPLVGLHRIGTVVFRWVAGVSVLMAVAFAIGPHLLMPGNAATSQITLAIGQMQQGINVLTICLLLFVCFSTKPLGLTFRSRIFGVSLGLGVFATVQLVQAAWYATVQAHSVYSPVYLFGTVGTMVAYIVWGSYFAVPEPERGMILLPTTSPYFLWNRISEALGDAPGKVAVSGFKPEMLHPTELMVLSAQSKAAQEKQRLAESQMGTEAAEEMEPEVASEPLKAAAGR